MRCNTACVMLFVAVFTTSFALGQGSNGAISGTVTDQTGAVLPGVSVTLENTQTGVASTTITNEAGVYSFPSVQPGIYRVAGELPGFKKLVNNDVRIEVAARISLNLQLEVGAEAVSVEVTAAMETATALGTSSVGGMITGMAVTQLPLPSRNALDLVATQAGIVGENLAGARIGALNITRDGINVMEQHINQGVTSVINTTTDLIQEVRVVTSPADAEFGRGAGQVQMLTRSGTNEFHGSLFESHRNTVLNANTWFNNQRGTPRNVLIRNQFGGRLGGPIIRNRTFFHFLYDGQREVTKNSVTSVTFTDQARQGIFRFYENVQNGNAIATLPTVNLDGSPRPPTPGAQLQVVDLFGKDPNRMVADRTGAVAAMLKLMPSPNNFRSGDGLNTAGYTWSRAGGTNRDQYNIKVDHTFNSKHTMNGSYTRELTNSVNGFLAAPFPGGPSGKSRGIDYFFSGNLTSTLTSRMVNEFRLGGQHADFLSPAPWDVPENEGQILKAGGQRYVIDFVTVDDPINQSNDSQGRMPPLYVLADNLSWISGRHSFKGGVEVRFRSSLTFSSFDSMPRAEICGASTTACTSAVQNINSTTIRGIGQNESAAQNLLNNLVGSLATVDQAFNSGKDLVYTPQYKTRHWQQREFSVFFKDDFKLRPSLTLNLGVRYEWYGVPYERHGKNVGVVGGSKSLFGITGTDWGDLYKPGVFRGVDTDVELVGKNSPNPDKLLYKDDWNNFAPAVGLSWSLPWWGKDKTILRLGYGVGYEINSIRLLNVVSGDQPGMRVFTVFRPNRYMDLSTFALPLTPPGKPLERVAYNDKVQTIRAYDTNLSTPYTQNWNLAVQRELPSGFTLDLRYVANKGTKLARGVTVNEVNIFENGILGAFNAVQAGGDSALLDQIFNGLNLGTGCTVNGTTVRAGACLRSNANTRTFFAQGNVGGFANYINTTTNFTNAAGGLIRNGRLPENLIVANPQFLHSRVTGNFANSTYHSMQADLTKRFSHGYTLQSNFTWSKALGEEEGAGQEMNDNYRNGRDRGLDKRLLSFDRKFVFRTNGTLELPFGPGRALLGGSSGFVARLVEHWQLGTIFNVFSGQPINFSSGVSSFNAETDGTPNQFGEIPRSGTITRVSDGIVYYQGVLQQVADPSLNGMEASLRARSTLRAIADSSGRIIMANPLPGQIGSMGYRTTLGPSSYGFDINLVKRVRIGEGKDFEFRVDAIDVLNTPHFGNPETAISDNNFGRITSATGNRIVVLNARINF